MNIPRCGVVFAITAVFALNAFVSAQSGSGGLVSMKLLTAETGWAASDQQLFWTTDAGLHWRDISPKMGLSGRISSVSFLDVATGWLLIGASQNGELQMELAATTDAGGTWSIHPINGLKLDPDVHTLGGDGTIDFVDNLHGWIDLGLVSGPAFRLGLLLSTVDGGETWSWVESPGILGAVRFVTLQDGWIAGGPDDQTIWSTHDGSKSWQQVSLKAPAQALAAHVPTYDLPTFVDAQRGFLPVTYSGREGVNPYFVLFATRDGGRTWGLDRVVPGLKESSVGQRVPADIVGTTLIVAPISARAARLELTTVEAGGKTSEQIGGAFPNISSVEAVSFDTIVRGWVLAGGELLSTRDGGANWNNVTPLQVKSAAPPSGATSGSGKAGTSLLTGLSTHLGFDLCSAPSAANMLTWWKASDLFDIGIYIGGASWSCSGSSSLNSTWINTVQTQGWGLMPIWAGPQAPCACWPNHQGCTPFPHVFHNNPTQAFNDGIAEATSAAAAAKALGLGQVALGSIIYYDMEQYSSGTCGAAVKGFVSGWRSQLDNNVYQDGVYGAPADAQTDWQVAQYPPHNVWIASWGANNINSPDVTVWGLDPLNDSLWATDPGSRIHQYLGLHTVSYGGLSLNIDHDIEDGPIVIGSKKTPDGVRNYTWTLTSLGSFPGACYTAGSGANDVGGIVGGYYTLDAIGQCVTNFYGFLFSGGVWTSLIAPGSLSTAATSINNAGTVVGYYEDGAYPYDTHGFIYQAGALTTLDYPGSTFTQLVSINDDGAILGNALIGNTQSDFLYQNGQYTVISYPGALATFNGAINGQGIVVGSYNVSQIVHGFTYVVSTGTYQSLDYPGSFSTNLFSANSNGQFVGSYSLRDGTSGYFLYDQSSNTYSQFPGAGNISPNINDQAQFVGVDGTTSPPSLLLATPQ